MDNTKESPRVFQSNLSEEEEKLFKEGRDLTELCRTFADKLLTFEGRSREGVGTELGNQGLTSYELVEAGSNKYYLKVLVNLN